MFISKIPRGWICVLCDVFELLDQILVYRFALAEFPDHGTKLCNAARKILVLFFDFGSTLRSHISPLKRRDVVTCLANVEDLRSTDERCLERQAQVGAVTGRFKKLLNN